jgi:hypothetical protein
MSWLRPHPHRGDVIAAGAVPLALATFVIDLRMTQWSTGARFVVIALITALLLAMAWLAELEGDAPRAYHSVLLVTGLVPLAFVLELLAELIGAHHPPGAGGDVWVFGLVGAAAVVFARRANSGVCTLIAALAGIVVVEQFVSWVFHPTGLGTFRAMLLVMTVAYGAGAVALRDHRRRHAVQLINAAGLASLLVALTYLGEALLATALRASGRFLTIFGATGVSTAPFGWKLYILAVGLGLVAYAAVDHESGPAYLGALVLLTFAALVGFPVSARGSLVGWPLFLLIVGAVGLVIGLRPRDPLPPEPPTAPPSPTVGTEAPPVPLPVEPPPTIPFRREDSE